jgi:hypothetical protein
LCQKELNGEGRVMSRKESPGRKGTTGSTSPGRKKGAVNVKSPGTSPRFSLKLRKGKTQENPEVVSV